jgi:hypothetical protein
MNAAVVYESMFGNTRAVAETIAEGLRCGRRAVALDTRLSYPLIAGAARAIPRRLAHQGYEVVARPTGFIVEVTQGPLKPGEHERARAWGAGLVRYGAR